MQKAPVFSHFLTLAKDIFKVLESEQTPADEYVVESSGKKLPGGLRVKIIL